MFSQIHTWLRNRRSAQVESRAAWLAAGATGSDGLTQFERDAIAAIESFAGPLAIERSGRTDRPTLDARVAGTELIVTLWGDEAQVHDVHGRTIYRAERWDFDSPQASIKDLVACVRDNLRSNNRLEQRVSASVKSGGVE